MSILQEIQKDLARKNIQPEEFKDRIIFMSMFNDIDWKKNDENCISNAEKVKNYAMKFSQGHRDILGPGSEEKWYGSSSYAQKRRMAFCRQQTFCSDTPPIQRNLVICCVQKCQYLESWEVFEARDNLPCKNTYTLQCYRDPTHKQQKLNSCSTQQLSFCKSVFWSIVP